MNQHAVLGAGAVGGLLGTLLAAEGDDVTFVVRESALADFPPQSHAARPDGTVVEAPVRATTGLTEHAAADVLWVATKATQLHDALARVAHARPRAVVPLLNGFEHLDVLRAVFGAERVVPGVIFVEADREGAGRFRQRSGFVNLRLAQCGHAALEHSAELLRRRGADVTFSDDETTLMWSKLAFLAPFSLTTSASGEPAGFIRDDATWHARFTAAAAEVVAVSRAEGATLDPNAAEALLQRVGAAMRSSMSKDLIAGNPPELDAIAGAILRAADRNGIDVPTLRDLAERVRSRL